MGWRRRRRRRRRRKRTLSVHDQSVTPPRRALFQCTFWLNITTYDDKKTYGRFEPAGGHLRRCPKSNEPDVLSQPVDMRRLTRE